MTYFLNRGKVLIPAIFFLFLAGVTAAQVPVLINYQGAVRDAAGKPLTGKISAKFEIQGSSSATAAAFSEEHHDVNVSVLGVFYLRIGSTSPSGITGVDWKDPSLQLKVSVDINNGSNYVLLGAQQMASVPYAVYSKDVESAYNGSVLTIGSSNYTLSVPATFTAGNGVSITGGVIANTAPDKTVTVTGGNSNVNVAGAYPDFTVSSTPTLTLNGDELSISNGNSVTIAPTLTVNGNVISVGPATNTVALPAQITPTIQSSGIAVVSPTTGNDFTVTVPSPTFSASGPVTITGNYPNLTVNSPVTPSLNATGIASITSGAPNYVVNVPTPAFTNSGVAQMQGSYPSYTVYAPQTNVTSTAGIATVSSPGTNSFNVNVPTPAFTNSGVAQMQGSYPSYTVYAPQTNVTSTAGIATVSSPGTNSFNVNVPTPAFTNSGVAQMQGTYPNYTVYAPQTNVTSTTGIAIVSSPGTNSFNVNVPPPAYTNSGVAQMQGSYPNYTVYAPQTNVTSTTGIATVSSPGTNSFNVNVPPPAFTNSGVAQVQGAYPNYTVYAPQTSVTSTAGIATVSSAGTNSFNVNVPPPAFTNSGSAQMLGTFPNYTVYAPTASVVGQGAATVTPSGSNFTVNVAPTQVTSTGVASVTATGNNTFNVDVPAPTYVASSGVLTLGSSTTVVAPALSFANNVLQAGPATNSVNISGVSPWSQSASTVALSTGTAFVGIGTSTPGALLEADVQGNNNSGIILRNSRDVSGAAMPVELQINTSGQTWGTNTYGRVLRLNQNTGSSIFDMGFNASGDFYLSGLNQYSPPHFVVTQGGKVGIGTSGSPTEDLQVERSASANVAVIAGSSNVADVSFGRSGNHNLGKIRYDNTAGSMSFWTNNTADRIFINSSGNVGIGTNTPSSRLHVNGSALVTGIATFNSPVTIADGSQSLNRILVSDAAGTASWQPATNLAWGINGNAGTSMASQFVGTTDNTGLSFRTNNANRMQIDANGYVGLNISPQSNYWFYTYRYNGDYGANRAGIASYRIGGSGVATNGGTDFSQAGVDAAIKGSNDWGNNYSAGVVGHGVNDYPYSTAVLGADWGANYWGALAYKDGGYVNYAGYFQGDVHVNGTLSKSAGTFRIDHPLDPLNKYLIHSFVESPDMMNVYNGNVTTDANGNAVVQLPSYFAAENIDYKYQLTVIGQFAQAIIAEEISNNQFTIRTDKPNVKVSWMVTGVRNDEYAKRHRVVPETEKNEHEKGTYLQPELFGLPVTGSAPGGGRKR